VLRGRFANLVKLDLQALEQETGFDGDTTALMAPPHSAVSGGSSNVPRQIDRFAEGRQMLG
jgi:hypothetical protein